MVRRIEGKNGLLGKTVGMPIAYERGRGVLSVIEGLEGRNSLGLNFRIPSHFICVFKCCYCSPTFIIINIIIVFIIWQDSLEVNPNVLIGSFLVGILPYGPFPWKRSYAVYSFFQKPANSNYEKKTCKYSHLRYETTSKIDILQSL